MADQMFVSWFRFWYGVSAQLAEACMRFMTMLKALREEAKLTQQALAERAKVSKRSLEGWEQGRRVPRVTVLPQLAEALGVPLARLVEGVVNDRLETLGQSSRRGRKAKEK